MAVVGSFRDIVVVLEAHTQRFGQTVRVAIQVKVDRANLTARDQVRSQYQKNAWVESSLFKIGEINSDIPGEPLPR